MLKQFLAYFINIHTDPSPANIVEQPSGPPPEERSPWKMPGWQAIYLSAFALVVGLIVFLRLFELDTLQAEIYGDIEIVLSYTRDIINGLWPYQFVLSAGPFYHYLIVPILSLTGPNYMGVKLASVIISLFGLAATYAASRRLVNDAFALLVLFIAGVSFLLLIFSRLGNSQIALPLLTMLALWMILRAIQSGHQHDVIVCAVVSSLGLFLYPQSFILPGVIFLTLLCLGWVGHSLPHKWWISFILASIPGLILFWVIFASDPANFNGYIGDKFQPQADTNAFLVLGGNIFRALTAFHLRGDEGFRSNANALPHLDSISGILFLVGIVFWFSTKERRRWVPFWLIPFLLLQVPSMLVINQPGEVPSASRTLGVVPIAYILVASGIWWILQFMRHHARRWLTTTVAVLLLGSILILNAQIYFQTYVDQLPYEDRPVAQRIAVYANSLPDDTQVYLVGCCWIDGMPESFILFQMDHPENLHQVNPEDLSCLQLKSATLPAVYVWNFIDDIPSPALEPCKKWLPAQLYNYWGKPIFTAATLHPELDTSLSLPEISPSLEQGDIELDGEMTHVEYSAIDIGSIGDLFDGNTDTLMRGLNANPMVVVLDFSQPREINTLELDLGTMEHFQVTVKLAYINGNSNTISRDYENSPSDPHISIELPESPEPATSIRVEIQNMDSLGDDSEYHIHLRELNVK